MLEKLQKLRQEREQGFTLIELLVVILIIGILAAIAIPAFLNQRKLANDAALQSDLSNSAKVVETMRLGKKGADAIPTTIDKSKLPLSNGTSLKYSGVYDSYCITGWNTGSNYDEKPLNWDSVKGGLLDDGILHEGGACTQGDITAPAPDDENGAVESGLGWTQADGEIFYWVTHEEHALAKFTFRVNTQTGETELNIHDDSLKFENLHGQVLLGGTVLNIYYDASTNKVTLDESLLAQPLFPYTWSDNPQHMSITDTPAYRWEVWGKPDAPVEEPVENPTEEPTEEPTDEPTEEPTAPVDSTPLTATFGAATVNIDRETGEVTGSFNDSNFSGVAIDIEGMDESGDWKNIGRIISKDKYQADLGQMVRSWAMEESFGDLSAIHEIRIQGYSHYY